MENVLVKSGKEESTIAANRAAERHAKLLLLVMRLEVHEGIAGRETAVSQVVEIGSMNLIRAGFCHHIDYCAAGAPYLCAIGIRGDSELLHNLIRELVRGTIPSTRLRKEGIIIIAAIDKIARLVAANAAKTPGHRSIRRSGRADPASHRV